MECSAFAKISALQAVYRAFFASVPSDRRKLIEAFFWIADELEDQLQAEGNLNDATFGAFQALKEFVDLAFMDPAQWSGRDQIDNLVIKLVQQVTDADDRAW